MLIRRIMDKELDFVLKEYKHGKFNPVTAIRRFRKKNPVKLRWIYPAVAAAAAVVAVVLFVHRQDSWKEYSAYDSPSVIMLADGSSVTLSKGASVRYQPHKSARRLELDGEAWFEVAHREDEPFEVLCSGPGYVKVLGTKFLVATRDGRTEVKVSEGKVLFAPDPHSEGVILSKGESALLEGEQPVEKVARSFSYEDAPLSTVIEELGNHFGKTLECDSMDKRVTGVFRADSLEDIVSALEDALDVTINVL